jgi:hypothetical protein
MGSGIKNPEYLPGMFMGKGPPAPPPPFVDNSLDKLMGEVQTAGAIVGNKNKDQPKKDDAQADAGTSDAAERRGGRTLSRTSRRGR